MNLGCAKTDLGNIDSGEFDLILDIGSSGVSDSFQKLNLTDSTFSQEITDLDGLANSGDIDGEMAVNEAHLVAESTLDTSDHVQDVTAHSSHTRELLAVSEPQVELDQALGLPSFFIRLAVAKVQVHVDVLEASCQGSLLSCDGDSTRLDLDLN